MFVTFDFTSLLVAALRECKKEVMVSFSLTIIASISVLIMVIGMNYLIYHVDGVNVKNCMILFFSGAGLLVALSMIAFMAESYLWILKAKLLLHCMPILWARILPATMSDIKQYSFQELVDHIFSCQDAIAKIMGIFFQLFKNILAISLIFICLFCYAGQWLPFLIFFYALIFLIKWRMIPGYIQGNTDYLKKLSCSSLFLREGLMHIQKITTANVNVLFQQKWISYLLAAKLELEKSIRSEAGFWLLDNTIKLFIFLIIILSLYFNTNQPRSNLLIFMVCSIQLSVLVEQFSVDVKEFIRLRSVLSNMNIILKNFIPDSALEQPSDLDGVIQFSNINFIHSASSNVILKKLDLSIKPKSFVAITGPSGSGKSTLLRLLAGIETAYTGVITINGQDIKKWDMAAARKKMGIVLQGAKLLPGTIHSNIAVNADVTLNDAWRLAELVDLRADIARMPMQMFTCIAENAGESLSGGQRQKILLARALSTSPSILLLDEATSALDNCSQQIIMKNLRALDLTLVVIAHRYNAIQDADYIYEMHQGTLIEVEREARVFDPF